MNEWKELYEITKKIQKHKPWEEYYDVDLFAIYLEGEEEPYWISFMGHAQKCKGILLYEGMKGYNMFNLICDQDQYPDASKYLIGEQNCLTCYMGFKDEIDDDMLDVIKNIGYRSTRDNWIYFKSFETRYFPMIPEQREVRLLIKVYKAVLYFLEKDRKHFKKINWEKEVLAINEIEDEYVSYTLPIPIPLPVFPTYTFADEFINTLKGHKRTDNVISMDLTYSMDWIKDDGYDKLINPLLFTIFDLKERMVLMVDLIAVDLEQIDVVIHALEGIIDVDGIPKEIVVRNPCIYNGLLSLCDKLDIKLTYDDLPFIDTFVEDMMDSMMNPN